VPSACLAKLRVRSTSYGTRSVPTTSHGLIAVRNHREYCVMSASHCVPRKQTEHGFSRNHSGGYSRIRDEANALGNWLNLDCLELEPHTASN
jgi:hypothetical protein